MSELAELPKSTIARTPSPVPGPRDEGPALWRGLLPLIAGLTGFVLALLLLRGTGWAQAGAVLAAFVFVYIGLGNLGKRRFGPAFDLTMWLCLIWVVLLVGAAILAPLLPLGEHEDIASTIGNPVMARPDPLGAYPLGTNNLGLDLLARLIYGARASLVVSVGAVLIGMVIGGAIGIAAGYFRKATDTVAGILSNSLLAVPPLILLIALATVLEPSLRNIAFALSLLALPSMIRMARASTLSFSQREFVTAGRAMGASNLRLMTRELLPNVLLPLASYAMVIVSVLIVAEASLSFLGLGIQAPDPSWGNMIAEGEGGAFEQHPHIVLVPGIVLFLTVYSFNVLGEKARKRFDSRQAKL
ncbi:ABC transporter permease [Prauserella marina]|uniref:Peptide/nickel transport system permease protein n=1 Tax=Prauserella marina TaxID=530584 RepID=A0A222VRA4_9PSEU|nr:ABC transporter permease [Prauserella marina]ASR36261.1 ABC transporter permease [Prauserella marina]PWV77033.1 peptide/nickel transport system permease protein [Prauserella marina]SDD02809.1 peptide/nickel transport system permease protein [Prauserella marina]